MKNLIFVLILVVMFLISCEKSLVNQPETIKNQHPQPISGVESKESITEKDRINLANKVLECLRNPREKQNKNAKKSEEEGFQGSLGLGGIFQVIEINYTDVDVLNCSNLIIDKLQKIYKTTKQPTVHEEIIRLYELIEGEETVPHIINLMYYHAVFDRHCEDRIMNLLVSRLKKYGYANYINTLYPLLEIEDEDVQIEAAKLLRELNPEGRYNLKYIMRKTHRVKSPIAKLHLLWTFSVIEPLNREHFVKYLNELLESRRNNNDGERDKILEVVKQTVPPSTLDLLFKLYEDRFFTDSQDYIHAMAGYYDDQRVKDLFFKILKDDDYVIKFKIAVIRQYSELNENSVVEHILKIADQEMNNKYDMWDENYRNVDDCLEALANNGDADTIKQLQMLKVKYSNYNADIEITIKKIESRLKK